MAASKSTASPTSPETADAADGQTQEPMEPANTDSPTSSPAESTAPTQESAETQKPIETDKPITTNEPIAKPVHKPTHKPAHQPTAAATKPPAPAKTEPAREEQEEAQPAVHTVEITNFAFSPHKLEIAKGDTVVFINKDEVSHTATADDGSFDTDLLAQDDNKRVSFAEAGEFGYYCAPHPGMRGTIVVKD